MEEITTSISRYLLRHLVNFMMIFFSSPGCGEYGNLFPSEGGRGDNKAVILVIFGYIKNVSVRLLGTRINSSWSH
jgi:hypothetical protein